MLRTVDILLALAALVLLLPLMLLLAAGNRITSGAPILFWHERIGLYGRPFMLAKFRTMVNNPEETGSWSTQPNDARVTRFGKFLRSTSLDELPQLWNILKGDMSMVGPRPDVPQQRKLYSPEDWQARVSVRPGLTGLAQATLRSSATSNERKALDLQYVRERSVGLNFWIMWKTVWQILTKGGY